MTITSSYSGSPAIDIIYTCKLLLNPKMTKDPYYASYDKGSPYNARHCKLSTLGLLWAYSLL